MSERITMAVKILPDRRDDYIAMHQNPDPAVAPALKEAHHENYCLSILDDLAVATFDYTGSDIDADRAKLRARPELQNWMAKTAVCQISMSEVPDAPVWTMMSRIF